MAERALRIGDLAAATSIGVETIRYYERIGLLPAPARTSGNYRAYGSRHLERLSFIRHARELGFPIEVIRDLLRLADEPERPCESADWIARTHLADVERKLARLMALKAELERMLAQCGQGRIAECHVIEVLADHSHARCLDPSHGRTVAEGQPAAG